MTLFLSEEPFVVGVVTIVVLFSLSYTLAVFLVSRRKRPQPLPPPADLYFVFVVPCLNEELVIGRSLEALLALPGDNFAVLVIDDGSDDTTSDVVLRYDPARVWLYQRRAPEARQGKGEALNAAYRYLRDRVILEGRSPDKVVIAIVDADGRVATNALHEVAPYFRNPSTGAVQIGVRMYNAKENLLARIQDFEFVTFTEIFQRARQRVGSVGLGGNGQFTRLSALESLGEAPWTDCLTEDLDLGIRLLVAGWTNNFCASSHVSQQAVTSFRRLVRQRARWFQGHLQCWKRLPMVMFARKLPDKVVLDLVYHLTTPALVLFMSLPLAAFVLSLISIMMSSPVGALRALTAGGGMMLVAWYLLSFGLAPFYAFSYWLRERDMSIWRALALAHVYNLYSYLWFAAGWMAVARMVFRRRGWAKTARTPDVAPAEPDVPEVAA